MTINEYEISNPFNPSIKLLPLIKMSKQNEEKKYAKNLLLNIKSNKSILDEIILRSKIMTNNIIKKIWKKNLIFAEINILRSEKKPIKKIALKKETKIKLFEFFLTIFKEKRLEIVSIVFPDFEMTIKSVLLKLPFFFNIKK